jgi:hypothetical protein
MLSLHGFILAISIFCNVFLFFVKQLHTQYLKLYLLECKMRFFSLNLVLKYVRLNFVYEMLNKKMAIEKLKINYFLTYILHGAEPIRC